MVLAEDPAAAVQGVLVQVAGGLYLAQGTQVGGQVIRGEQGAGVVLAQDPELAFEGVLVQVAGGPQLAQDAQVDAQVIHRGQGLGWSSPRTRRCGAGCPGPGHGRPAPGPVVQVIARLAEQGLGVVVAQDPAPAVQGVLVQVAGGLRLAEPVQVGGEVIGGGQGAGVVLAEDPAAAIQYVLIQVAGLGPAAHLLQRPAEVVSDRQRVLMIVAEPVTPLRAQVAVRAKTMRVSPRTSR